MRALRPILEWCLLIRWAAECCGGANSQPINCHGQLTRVLRIDVGISWTGCASHPKCQLGAGRVQLQNRLRYRPLEDGGSGRVAVHTQLNRLSIYRERKTVQDIRCQGHEHAE